MKAPFSLGFRVFDLSFVHPTRWTSNSSSNLRSLANMHRWSC